MGRSSFISTTTSLHCAEAGTGNTPDPKEQERYEIYVLKVPQKAVLKRPAYLDKYGMDEREYLVADCILPEEIIASFPRAESVKAYNFLHNLLGIEKTDLAISEQELVSSN